MMKVSRAQECLLFCCLMNSKYLGRCLTHNKFFKLLKHLGLNECVTLLLLSMLLEVPLLLLLLTKHWTHELSRAMGRLKI